MPDLTSVLMKSPASALTMTKASACMSFWEYRAHNSYVRYGIHDAFTTSHKMYHMKLVSWPYAMKLSWTISYVKMESLSSILDCLCFHHQGLIWWATRPHMLKMGGQPRGSSDTWHAEASTLSNCDNHWTPSTVPPVVCAGIEHDCLPNSAHCSFGSLWKDSQEHFLWI
jgi:hypothetical protein